MKKYWVRGLGVFGALFTIQTVVWEYARMRPDYGFIVDPWSIRGYESVHGAIVASIGVLALLSFLLVAWKGSERFAIGASIVAFMAVGATAITAVFGGGDYTFTPGFLQIGIVTLIIGTVLYRLVRSSTRNTAAMQLFWLRLLILFAIFGGVGFMINAAYGGEELSVPQWGIIAVVFVLLAGLSLSAEPRELAANRMLMFSSAFGSIAIAMSAGAVRSTLVVLQGESGSIAAAYRDTQVTSGHLMAVFGMFLVFLASVALWARRRDLILTAARAAKQRAAAEASAAEIAAAMEKVSQSA